MPEEKTYIYFLECSNCKRINPLKISLGIPVSKFITETKIAVCSYCGCDPAPDCSPLNE